MERDQSVANCSCLTHDKGRKNSPLQISQDVLLSCKRLSEKIWLRIQMFPCQILETQNLSQIYEDNSRSSRAKIAQSDLGWKADCMSFYLQLEQYLQSHYLWIHTPLSACLSHVVNSLHLWPADHPSLDLFLIWIPRQWSHQISSWTPSAEQHHISDAIMIPYNPKSQFCEIHSNLCSLWHLLHLLLCMSWSLRKGEAQKPKLGTLWNSLQIQVATFT